MPERAVKLILAGLGLMVGAGALYLAGRFLLPWTAPLLAGWVLAALLEPAVGFLTRRRWRRGAAAALCTLTALGLVLWGLSALISRGLSAATALTRELPALMEAMSLRLGALEAMVVSRIHAAPAPTAELLERTLSALGQSAAALPGQLSRGLVSLLSRTAQASPDTLLFLVTAGTRHLFHFGRLPHGERLSPGPAPGGAAGAADGSGRRSQERLRGAAALAAHADGPVLF